MNCVLHEQSVVATLLKRANARCLADADAGNNVGALFTRSVKMERLKRRLGGEWPTVAVTNGVWLCVTAAKLVTQPASGDAPEIAPLHRAVVWPTAVRLRPPGVDYSNAHTPCTAPEAFLAHPLVKPMFYGCVHG